MGSLNSMIIFAGIFLKAAKVHSDSGIKLNKMILSGILSEFARMPVLSSGGVK